MRIDGSAVWIFLGCDSDERRERGRADLLCHIFWDTILAVFQTSFLCITGIMVVFVCMLALVLLQDDLIAVERFTLLLVQ